MKKVLTLALCLTLGLALAVASQAAIDDFNLAKDYRNTSVCFEQDNDGDGLFNEDPVNWVDPVNETGPIDDDGDGLFNEDDVDCPDGTCLGGLLPQNADNYTLEAVLKKNDKVSSYNPGQYYAVSTVYVNDSVDKLTIEENWTDCAEISELSPRNGGGSVVIVQVGPGDDVAYQILDAKSEEVTVVDCTATVELENVTAGTTIRMYVKFAPGLKGELWEGPYSCVNANAALVNISGVETELTPASATLELIQKAEE